MSFSCRRFLFDQGQQPWERLRGAVPEDYDAKRREEFIVKACEHYARYLRRQRDKDAR